MNLSETKLSILVGIAAIITSITVVAMLVHLIGTTRVEAVKQYKDQLTTTRRVCLESRHVINGAMEARCGQLQDATDTEFICDVMDRCWLEWHGYPSHPSDAPKTSHTSS